MFVLFQIKRLYKVFIDVDCLQLEVNPLAETPGETFKSKGQARNLMVSPMLCFARQWLSKLLDKDYNLLTCDTC